MTMKKLVAVIFASAFALVSAVAAFAFDIEFEVDTDKNTIAYIHTDAGNKWIELYSKNPTVAVFDEADLITEYEEQCVAEYAYSFAQKSGMNVIIATTDNIGTKKTDIAVMNYADDIYDGICGINTDGVLLLINCDTNYDWISTSGSAINYYSDARIDYIFDEIYDDLVDEDFYSAMLGFVQECDYYYDMGKANTQIGIGIFEFDVSGFIAGFFGTLMPFGIFALIIGVVVYNLNIAKYSVAKATTAGYVRKDMVYFEENTDVSLGVTVNRVYSPASSSSYRSSGGGGRSGRSSTHRSRSGGRHGGGGRRR